MVLSKREQERDRQTDRQTDRQRQRQVSGLLKDIFQVFDDLEILSRSEEREEAACCLHIS